jgi:hypothetical protein
MNKEIRKKAREYLDRLHEDDFYRAHVFSQFIEGGRNYLYVKPFFLR